MHTVSGNNYQVILALKINSIQEKLSKQKGVVMVTTLLFEIM